jgi:HD-GYP domain-containing protein (c-di-GMP phosphodiesterase class II)
MLLMKQHPFYTYHLLSRIEAFNTIKEWASFHHEKLNGKGYPFGLNARHIPLGARIMAVSDVYQALTDERPYRNPMGKKEAFSILQKMVQEKHLDGDVVKMLQQQV